MIWFTWRQFRTQAWVTIGLLVVAAIVLAIAGRNAAALYAANGIPTCTADCDSLVTAFLRQIATDFAGRVYDAAIAVMYVVPALIGVFWGAPLIAREIETGTHRLVWSQSVTRTRWLVTKLVGLGAASLATMGILSAVMTWSSKTIDHAADDRLTPLLFGARGIAPLGYALFAFALGVALGMLIRRTVPAMAATLGVYVAVALTMPLWLRAHLAPMRHSAAALNPNSIDGFTMSNGGIMSIIGHADLPGAWIISNESIKPNGDIFTGPADPTACGRDLSPKTCLDWVGTLNLRQDLSYHSADQFWSLQWAEFGILVGLALGLAGLCVWWIRRRIT
jgi:ABC-type transport system involved in multi-copper enzyme maturation permease subunit